MSGIMGDAEGGEFVRGGSESWDSIPSYSQPPIEPSNIGFQLLKKQGWKEGTGLGVSEQGRLEPVQAYLKKNKRGLGSESETVKKKPQNLENFEHPASDRKIDKVCSGERAKTMSKRTKKMQEFEKRLQEKELERAFFREFWPDNV